MTRTTLCASLIGLSALAYACGMSSASLEFAGSPDAREGAGSDGGALAPSAGGSDPALRPTDNAVILVHAAKSLPFRLCFESEPDRLPMPDSELMPESNVVGVEVGSAIRLGPLAGPPGAIYVFDEPLIRALYPAFGGPGKGPTCGQLLAANGTKDLPKRLDAGPRNNAADKNLSKDVHLLVLTGCTGNTTSNTYSQEECGTDWSPIDGNIAIKEITIPGANRTSPKTLPAQIVNLAQPLESARAGRVVNVTFGDLKTADAKHAPVSSAPKLFGDPSPTEPTSLPYDADDISIYETVGFRVQLETPSAPGTPPEVVLDQSLARVQKLSSPRDLPPSYFAAASNYALLLLGDPAPKLKDGGPDDSERRNLHLLAVPVINPKGSAASDAGPDAP
jgi:hypothetical protein